MTKKKQVVESNLTAAVSLPVIGYFINNRIGLDPLGYKKDVVESTLVVTFTFGPQ